jgi:RNA polymerase sigma-70 factor (ECF subfamily)
MNLEIERFEKNIVPMRHKLFQVALKYLQQKEDAEDAVQEAMLKLWTILGQMDKVSTPEAFAMQTTINICIDKLRTRKDTVMVDDNHLEQHLDTPYSELERKDAVDLVGRIIESLPYVQRTIIRMRDIEGCELEDIASITGAQVSAVTMNLSRARKKVREEFIKANDYYIYKRQ